MVFINYYHLLIIDYRIYYLLFSQYSIVTMMVHHNELSKLQYNDLDISFLSTTI